MLLKLKFNFVLKEDWVSEENLSFCFNCIKEGFLNSQLNNKSEEIIFRVFWKFLNQYMHQWMVHTTNTASKIIKK